MRVGPIKLFLDGGMLNGSAYMREPWPKGPTYQIDEDGYRGLLFIQPEQLRMVVEEGAKRKWQMTAHTAGDALQRVLGDKRMRWFQPYKTWMQYTTIGGGSDHMVKLDSLEATNPWNPWLGMWTTLERRTERGPS